MEKRIVLWTVIGVLFVVALFLTFKATALSAGGSGKLDTTGWTENELMNYEMHGTVPARLGTTMASTGSSGGMVGGC
ncbi:MAG: hypothetical protein AABY15_07695 [Nanoarchaeota archaeon]